jgi:hypothetical protein
MKRLSKKQKIKIDRGIRRQVDLDLGFEPPKSKIHKNKTKYNRKNKYKEDYEKDD